MKTSYTHAEPNNLIYTVKTHYAGLLLDRLRDIDDFRTDPMKHNPDRVHITEIYDDGSEDNTDPKYTLRYHTKQSTHVLEIVISESLTGANSDRIVKTMELNDEEKHYKYTFLVRVLRGLDGNPIILPTGVASVTNKNAESRIDELDREILTTLDLCVN